MATAQLQYRVNGGALHEDSIEVAGGDVITLTAASFAGWGTPAARWEIVAFPPGFTVPAGWSENSSARNFYYLANSGGSGVTPPAITLPMEATRWGKWLFRLTVNGTVISSTIGAETLSPALGLHDLAVGEGAQFGGTRQWVGDQQDNERTIDAAALASGGFVSSLAATTPIVVSASTGAVTASWSPSADVAMGSHKITGVTDPTNPQDAATKAYVDAVALGLDIHGSVLAATTANITLSGEQTIDAVAVTAGKRVLVKDQSTGSQNGFYLCAAGSWTRAADLPTGASAAGAFCFVEQGTIAGDKGYVCTTNAGSDVVGTNALVFTQFTGAGGGADASVRYVVDSATATNANDIPGRALASTLALTGTSGTIPLSLSFLAATGSGASGYSLEVRRALTSGVGTTGTFVGVKFTLPDYGSGADIAAATARVEATAGLGTTIVTKLVLATSNGAGPVDMLTLAGNGAVRMHLYTAGRALFDGSGNITSTAITAAEVQTACAALASSLAVNSQKITGLLAGSGSGEAVEFGQLASYATAATTITAGAGLTGGGDLSANRTLDIAAADASITVNANSIEASGAFVAKNISTTGTISTGVATITLSGIGTTKTRALEIGNETASGTNVSGQFGQHAFSSGGVRQNMGVQVEANGAASITQTWFYGTGTSVPSSQIFQINSSDSNLGAIAQADCFAIRTGNFTGFRFNDSNNRGGLSLDNGDYALVLKSYNTKNLRFETGADSGGSGGVVRGFWDGSGRGRFVVKPVVPTSAANAVTFNLATSQNVEHALTENTTVSFSGATAGMHGVLVFKQDGTGRTVTMPTNGSGIEYDAAILALTVTGIVDTTAGYRTVLNYYVLADVADRIYVYNRSTSQIP